MHTYVCATIQRPTPKNFGARTLGTPPDLGIESQHQTKVITDETQEIGLQSLHRKQKMINQCTRVIALLSATSLLGGVEGRKWQDVVDHKIYLQPNLDSSRHQLKIEMDPFFVPADPLDVEPTRKPVSKVWVTKSPPPTSSPTAKPTGAPTETPTGPTSSPTLRSENIDGNGGCPLGTSLYRVNMYDSWGDGWSDATMLVITGFEDQDTRTVSGSTVTKTHISQQGNMTVSITQTVELTSDHPFGTAPADEDYTYVSPLGKLLEGTLYQGSQGHTWVCLVPRRCYDVVVSGGDYLEEVSWSIESVFGTASGPLVEGGAPHDCSFSIPDEDGLSFCEATCSSTLNPENTVSPAMADYLTSNEEKGGVRFEFWQSN